MTGGYSNELYDTIAAFGLRRGASIFDVGCGTAIASEPFASSGFSVTRLDSSDTMLEAFPFPDERFDAVIAAQTFRWADRARALSQAHRVLRPGGTLAMWWKNLMARDPLKILRDEVCAALGKPPVESGLTGGFREFYASAFKDQTLRVLPWRTAMPLDEYLAYERSRGEVHKTLGAQANQYFRVLEQRLRERAGSGNPMLSPAFVQYLYMAKK